MLDYEVMSARMAKRDDKYIRRSHLGGHYRLVWYESFPPSSETGPFGHPTYPVIYRLLARVFQHWH